MLFKRFIASAGLRIEHHEVFGVEALPKLGLVVHVHPKTVLRFSAAKGFRSPSIRELYFWATANDALKPDRLWNYELGWIQNMGSRFKLDLALFESRGSDLIQFNAPPPQWVNSGTYTHRGYEIILQCKPVERMEIDFAWSHIQLSKDVFNIPAKKLTASLQYAFNRFTLAGNLVSVQDLTGAEFPDPGPVPVLHPIDDYTVVDLTAFAMVMPRIRLKLALKNVLNACYEAMYGYPMPGRHFSADLAYQF